MRITLFAVLLCISSLALHAQTAAGYLFYSGGSLPSASSMNGKTILVKDSDGSGNAGSGVYTCKSNGTSWTCTAVGSSSTGTIGHRDVPSDSTVYFDLSLATVQLLQLSANVSSANNNIYNFAAGQNYTIIVCQPASGGPYTFSWPSAVLGGMTIGTTANTCSSQMFVGGRQGSSGQTRLFAVSTGVTGLPY